MTDRMKKTYSKLGTKTRLSLMIAILAVVLASFIIPAFAIDGVIVVGGTQLNIYPDGHPLVRCYVTDAVYNLDPATLVAKIDGQAVTATFDTYPVVGPSKKGTIRITPPILSDGSHEAEVSITDEGGNQLNYKWSFTIMLKPTFSAVTPAMYEGVPGGAASISMVITDNGTIDWPNLYFRINGIMRTPEINKETGLVVFRGPFPSGQCDVYVSVKDIKGNEEHVGYWFYNNIGDPKFTGIDLAQWTPFLNGLTITDGILKFSGNVSDYNNVNITSLTGTLDGVPLNIAVSPGGKIPGDALTLTHYNYSGVVKDGNHTLVLNALDQLGKSTSLTRTFTVKAPPVISNMAPVKYGVQELTQLISADAIDPNGTVVPASVILTFDGVKVNHNYDSATGKLTFRTGQLSDESYHTATLSVTDDFGLTATKTWKFFADSHNYPDMADSSANNCMTCHPSITTLEDHPLTFYSDSDHSAVDGACTVCHKYITEPVGCAQCHGYPDTYNGDSAPHGSTLDKSYGVANNDPTIPIRVNTNREVFDCIICHQPGAGTVKASGASLNNHDIPELHKYTEEAASCNSCHAQSLTKEHARPGRVDKDGKAVTCNTCHQSTDPLVVSAIANHKKNCDACHTVTDHEKVHTWSEMGSKCQTCHQNTLTSEHVNRVDTTGKKYDCDTCHNSTETLVVSAIANNTKNCDACHVQADHEKVHIWNDFDAKCQTCHQSTLSSEHLNRVNPTTGKNFDCDTCHGSNDKAVKRTIASNNLSCTGCHKTGHNIPLADTVPVDILQYPGHDWTTPIDASIFQGELTTPIGYEAGQVVISNRVPDITIDQIWNYYNVQADTKMAAKGWTIKSGSLASGANSFIAEYEKQGRFVTIKCYNSALSNGSGPLGTGYKIELWYK